MTEVSQEVEQEVKQEKPEPQSDAEVKAVSEVEPEIDLDVEQEKPQSEDYEEITDENLLEHLFNTGMMDRFMYWLYDNTSVESVSFKSSVDGKEQTILQYKNTWSCGEVDSSKECDGYRDCDLNLPEPSVDGTVTYNISMDDQSPDESECKLKIDFREFVRDYMDKEFLQNYKIVLINDSGFNQDHRGSDHTRIELPFYSRCTLYKNTVREFIQGMYRIKSHKFDHWYELFCHTTVSKKKDKIIINVTYDHGS